MEQDEGREPEGAVAAGPASRAPIPVVRFSTAELPPDERYRAWRTRDWPRAKPVFRTEPSEPFSTHWETVMLGPVVFIHTRITAMRWERRLQDIRESDFDPIIITMMIKGLAQGDLDGRAFREPSGTYHFHDLARPSLHVSTASETYSLIIPRPVAREWFGSLRDLHGLVVDAAGAAMMLSLAAEAWRALPRLDAARAERLGRAFLELAAIGAAGAGADRAQPTALGIVRRRAVEEIERRLGSGDVSVAELCRAVGVSRGRLFAVFNEDGGVQAYVLSERLRRARHALADLERVESIGGIAHRLGFSDAAHLSRAFRQRYGMTPRDYRRLVASNAEAPGGGGPPGEPPRDQADAGSAGP